MSSSNDGPRSSRRKPRVGDTTAQDAATAHALAHGMKRDIALEKARQSEPATDEEDARAVIVLGPDGVPQFADPPDEAPETVRIDLPDDEPPPAKRGA